MIVFFSWLGYGNEGEEPQRFIDDCFSALVPVQDGSGEVSYITALKANSKTKKRVKANWHLYEVNFFSLFFKI